VPNGAEHGAPHPRNGARARAAPAPA
jgi:hypothetical protein